MSRNDRYSHRYESYSLYPKSKSKGERADDAAKKRKALEKKGAKLSPVILEGSAIASTFWGKAWCKNIESYHDYENRLPRGRSYVRSSSVIDLQIEPGLVRAQVMGSRLYTVEIRIKPVPPKHWAGIRTACAGKIGSLVELLQGRISGEVMEVMTRRDEGLFPKPAEISFTCTCPDWATLCKHVAAAMYGIGSRLDTQPELLFLLRGVDSADLIASAAGTPVQPGTAAAGETLAAGDLADVFGVEMETPLTPSPAPRKPHKKPTKQALPPPPAAAKKPLKKPTKKALLPLPAAAPKKPRGRPRKSTV